MAASRSSLWFLFSDSVFQYCAITGTINDDADERKRIMLTQNLLKHGLISTSRTSKESIENLTPVDTIFAELEGTFLPFSSACLLSGFDHVQRTCALALFTLNSHVPSKYVSRCNLTDWSTEIHLDLIGMVYQLNRKAYGFSRRPRRVELRRQHRRRRPRLLYHRDLQWSKVRIEIFAIVELSLLFQWEQENPKSPITRALTPRTTSSLRYEPCMSICWSRRKNSICCISDEDRLEVGFIFSDLEPLKQYRTRSPYSDEVDNTQMLTVYRRGDVEKR